MYKILIVDDEPANLKLLQNILEHDYELSFATSGTVALSIARKLKPDMILLDVMMPEIDGFEVCSRLKAMEHTAKIPVIFVTALNSAEDEVHGFEAGGVDFIKKPISSHLVLTRVATHLALYNQRKECERAIKERTEELENSYLTAISMLAEAGHYNDTDTGVHVWRMAAYAGAIGRAAGWSVDDAKLLEMACTMHDTGKIGTPDSILKKPAGLSEMEFNIIKEHTTIGYSILTHTKKPTRLFNMAADIALCHHEKWNGTGYPEGLVGDRIPEAARICAIADVFDALTMRRPYKPPWPVEDALAEIIKGAGAHFDPRLVDIFVDIQQEILELKDLWEEQEDSSELYYDVDNFISIL